LKCDIAVIGGGVLGVTMAFWVSELYECSVVVLDRAEDVALHTTLRNTGLVHRPYYLDPVKKRLFARSAERSYHLWKKLASRFNLPWNEVGTLMVATGERQTTALEGYMRWGRENGMDADEYQLLDAAGVRTLEPGVRCEAAILANRDTSTDYAALTRAVWGLASRNGARFLPGADATRFQESNGRTVITLGDGRSLECSLLVNMAGGGALKIAHAMGLGKRYGELYFRGDYWEVNETSAPRVSRNVYAVARHPELPFLDPHFVVRSNGTRVVGPNAALVAATDAYEGIGGVWRFVENLAERPLAPKARLFSSWTFLSLVWDEWRSSLSKSAMCGRVRKFIPSISPEMLTQPGLAGVRSSLVDSKGFVPEAVVLEGPGSLHVLNYNSPGATGAPVFSAALVRRLEEAGTLRHFQRKSKRDSLWSFDDVEIG